MYDNTVSARTYLSYIAEQAGGIAVIGRDGKLYIKTIGESSVTLPLKLFKTFKWGEKFKITRVRYDDGIQLFEKGDTTGNTVYISQDNMYIVDQDQINNIYNTLKGLEFYSFEGESIIDPALDTGDIVVIDGKNVIYQGSMQFSGRWIANIESKIQCKAKEETTTRTPSQRTINRRVESNINQIDGKITQLTEETTENTQKITKVEQDVNGITSKVSSVEQSVENITNTQGEAEGKNIHIEDSSEEPFVDISLHGESIQEGTPTPDSPIEIENIEGKNKFDYESAINVENLTYDNTYAFFEIKNIKPNTAYTISNLKLTDLTNLGYSVYAGLTIGNTYSTGPGKAFHCCIYNNVYKNGIGVVTGYSDTKANGGKLYFCIATTNTNEDLAYERFIKICSMVFDKAQIEEGSVATPYVPYNSLEFKVEGKNKFNVQDTNNVTEGITVDNEGWITVTGDNTDGTATKYFNYYTNNLNLKTGTNFNVIAEVKNVSGTGNASFVSVNSSPQQFKTNFYRNFSVLANNTIYNSINETSDEFLGNTGLRTFISFSAGQSGSITFRLSLLEDTTITPENFDYEPYKSQVATFPLGNQKLMEGSYLDDEGIHRARKQVVFDGSEIWSKDENKDNSTDYFYIRNIGINTNNINSVICDYFKKGSSNVQGFWATTVFCITINKTATGIVSSDTKDQRVAKWKTWLSEHPITVEYELSEEETIPYTAEQQEAWEKIKALTTYKNVTNITSTAYAKVTYMRDNGLDVYETKQNAEKNYTETTKKLAEQKITVDEIVSEVSKTKSNINTINNNLIELNETVSTTEQRVNKYEIKFEEKTKTINEELKENSETIKSMSYTFNTDELSIAKSDDPVNAKINNSGMRVYSYNELKAIFNDKGTGIQKLIVVGSAQIGNLQIVKATDENGEACTDFHHLVSNIQELTDLEV